MSARSTSLWRRPIPARLGGGVGLAIALHLGLLLWLLSLRATRAPEPLPVQTISASIVSAPQPAPAPPPPEPAPEPPRPEPTPPPAVKRETAIKRPPVRPTPRVAPTPPAPPAPSPAPAAPSAPARAEPPPPVEPPRFDAAYLSNPHPAYPPMSRRLGEQGRVLLEVAVSAGGLPESVSIARSSGHPRLDEAARKAVLLWKFKPAQQGGSPIAARVNVPIQFSLKPQSS